MNNDELIARAEATFCRSYDTDTEAFIAQCDSHLIVTDMIAALRAEKEARERAEEHARAGWALATHWQDRYTERAMADDAALELVKQQAADEALERAADGIHEEWISRGGMNCTETCATIRAMKGGA